MLKRSAHDRNSPLRAAVLGDLDALGQAEKNAIDAGIGIGIVFDHGSHQEKVNVRAIIDAYFHGKYVHRGNSKTDLARRLDDLGPWGRLTLYTVMLQVRNVYVMAGSAAARVLGVSHLLDADVSQPAV